MTIEPNSREDNLKVAWTVRAFAHETVLLDDDDDVEAHGMLGVVAAAAIMAGSAGGAFIASAGSALAPEPVQTTSALSGTTGYTAAGTYVNSGTATNVVKWPSSATGSVNGAPLPAPGTPCSTSAMALGAETTKVIVAAGSLRRCF